MKTFIQTCLFFLIISLTLPSCKKVFYGEGKTIVRGQVIDAFSGEVLSDAWVQLRSMKKGLPYVPTLIDSFPTDENGKFNFSFNADQDYEYYLRGSYKPLYTHVKYRDNPAFGHSFELKNGRRNVDIKLQLEPLGWVKMNFKNVPPLNKGTLEFSTDSYAQEIYTDRDTIIVIDMPSNNDVTVRCWIYNYNTVVSEHLNSMNIPPLDTLEFFYEY